LSICAGLMAVPAGPATTVLWSPYQKLTVTPQRRDGQIVSYEIETNGSWYQHIIDLSPSFVTHHLEFFRATPAQWNAYNLPYRLYPHPASVLVLGAGTGNDVAAALRNGAGRVVAVEIDPLILTLGRKLHFEQPYSSPRVQVVVDDARSYIQNCYRQFDFIVFSLLDSHTTSSHYSNIRIDNYVYTIEALQATRRLLKPNGLLIIKFQVKTPWIAGRLRDLLTVIFGEPPLHFQTDAGAYSTGGRFFVSGDQHRIQQVLSNPELSAYVARHSAQGFESAALTTDDWPYFYQHQPGLPISLIVHVG
jgi:spermidine synthase